MIRCRPFLVPFTWLLVSLASNAVGQWTIVAKNVVHILQSASTTVGGVITFKDGKAWAGYDALTMSPDSGLTWLPVPSLDLGGDYITSVRFFDRDTGIVLSSLGPAQLTTDGGQSWRPILDRTEFASVAFGATAKVIVASLFAPGTVTTSTDLGKTWRADQTLNTLGRELISNKGTLWFLSNTDAVLAEGTGSLYSSSDEGATWQQHPNVFDPDSYMFAIDSCNVATYVINEATADAWDLESNIYKSTGGAWTPVLRHTIPYLNGSIALGKRAVYAMTLSDGILRSTDQGNTWDNIGGPQSTANDAEFLCAIDDNLVLAVDGKGNIWRTTNAGGDALSVVAAPLGLSDNVLFAKDTVSVCLPRTRHVVLTPPKSNVCAPPTIISQTIVGPDASHYRIVAPAAASFTTIDSIVVEFSPDSVRKYNATLQFSLSNGDIYSVDLQGYASPVPELNVFSQNILTDTIGGDVFMPITLSGAAEQGFDLHVAYDPSILTYIGTRAPRRDTIGPSGDTIVQGGDTLDVPNPTIAKGAYVHIPARASAYSDTTVAYAHFLFYPTSERLCAEVHFEIVGVEPGVVPCLTSTTQDVQVCAPEGCGTSYYTALLRGNPLPLIDAMPNPARDVVIVHTSTDIPVASVSISSLTGLTEYASTTSLSKSDPLRLSTSSIPNGVHFLRIQSGEQAITKRIVIRR